MSVKVIELNDSAVSVSDESGLLVQSPGFAFVGERGLEVGRAAEQQARLRPTSSFNKFWHQLSLEPLGYATGNVRHFADLAYAHLLHLAEEAQLEGDVIFAVPGNFTSQQLAILLGLARQCPFNPVGVVDAALASTIRLVKRPSLVFADIQLHQALLTRFSIRDGLLQRESVVQIPEAGLQNFHNLVMQLATGLFIQQCRFNPQHDAATEQQLYNAVPEWLAEYGENRSSLLMELKTSSAVHQAKLPWETLLQRLGDFYGRITQQIVSIAGEQDTQLVVSATLAGLPDFARTLADQGQLQIARPETLGKTCIELASHINGSDEGFRFVTSLPVAAELEVMPVGSTASQSLPAGPTHLLFGSDAVSLGKVIITNRTDTESPEQVNGKTIELAVNGLPDYLGQIEKEGDHVSLVCGEAGALVNGARVSGKQPLALGDRVQFNENGESICLIRVRDGIQ
ncbi:MAG: hypothetical protein R3F41_18765 [Gammaproteobacteria bacterium]|nr:hypothetical protein [Pseudomonadales bacterium]MCP5347595.1 hypothetical protein [Pseudomonadales bacterium]